LNRVIKQDLVNPQNWDQASTKFIMAEPKSLHNVLRKPGSESEQKQ